MSDEIIVKSSTLLKLIKQVAKTHGINMRMLKVAINAIFNKQDGVHNLYNKFNRRTLRVSELEEIAEVLNCELVLRPKA